jgi:hypothetical protein
MVILHVILTISVPPAFIEFILDCKARGNYPTVLNEKMRATSLALAFYYRTALAAIRNRVCYD